VAVRILWRQSGNNPLNSPNPFEPFVIDARLRDSLPGDRVDDRLDWNLIRNGIATRRQSDDVTTAFG
jgi:hypothetical protein